MCVCVCFIPPLQGINSNFLKISMCVCVCVCTCVCVCVYFIPPLQGIYARLYYVRVTVNTFPIDATRDGKNPVFFLSFRQVPDLDYFKARWPIRVLSLFDGIGTGKHTNGMSSYRHRICHRL